MKKNADGTSRTFGTLLYGGVIGLGKWKIPGIDEEEVRCSIGAWLQSAFKSVSGDLVREMKLKLISHPDVVYHVHG